MNNMLEDFKKRVSHRARIIEGQFKGLTKAIDQEEYSVSTLTQSLAIQKSLQSLDKLMLEDYLRTNFTHSLYNRYNDYKEPTTVIEEIVSLCELGNYNEITKEGTHGLL